MRTGDRGRSVLLKPSRKCSLLLVGLGVREDLSVKPLVRDRCRSVFVVVAAAVAVAVAADVIIAATNVFAPETEGETETAETSFFSSSVDFVVH